MPNEILSSPCGHGLVNKVMVNEIKNETNEVLLDSCGLIVSGYFTSNSLLLSLISNLIYMVLHTLVG